MDYRIQYFGKDPSRQQRYEAMVVPKNVEKAMTHTNEAKCQIAMVDGGRKN